DSTSNVQAITIQTGCAWANRLRNSPRPGPSVTTTTPIATQPPILNSPRLSRRGETSPGSGSGSASRELLLSAIAGGWFSLPMARCGDVIGGCGGLACAHVD